MNEEERYEKWKQKYINIPRKEQLKMAIIGECRRLDKADVYEWVYQDEMKIRQLMNNWNELKKWLEEEKGQWGKDNSCWYESVLDKMQELEQVKDEDKL